MDAAARGVCRAGLIGVYGAIPVALGLEKLAGLNPWSTGGLVAVDFGSQSLKVLQLTPGDPPQLVAAACVQTPNDLVHDATKRLEFQCEQLPGLIKSGGFKARRGVCSIPTAHLYCKHLQVVPEAGQKIDQATIALVAAQLGCEISMLSCRSIVALPAPSAGGKNEVIALATANSLVNRLMQALRAARLEPAGMQSEFQAILNAFRPVNRRTTDKEVATLYLDIGSLATNVCVGHGAQLVFAKAIAMGGRYLDQVVAQQAGCSMTEARALRLGMTTLSRQPAAQATDGAAVLAAAVRKDQLAENGQAVTAVATPVIANGAAEAAGELTTAADKARSSVDLSEPLRALTDEIMMCVRYYDTLFPTRRIARTIFVGGESRHTALCQHIARLIKTPAHAADPLARVARAGSEPVAGLDLNQPQPGWTVPYGLLMTPTDA